MTTYLQINRITPIYPRGNFVEWEWVGNPPAGSWDFIVERSESPNGPFTVVSDPKVTNNLSFFDPIALHNFGQTLYYRVMYGGMVTCEYISTPVCYQNLTARLPKRFLGEIAKMRHDLSVLLNADSGIPIAVYKRKTIGELCTDCGSSFLEIAVKDNCGTCYGTRFVGGFYSPIFVKALFNNPPVQENLDIEGETQSRVYNLKMLDVPILSVDDIIFEVERGVLYEVKNVLTTERRRTTVHQEPTVSELPRSHPYYDIVNNVNQKRFGYEIHIFDTSFKRY